MSECEPNNGGPFRLRPGDQLPQRVAVLRALMVGDLLCAVPAMRALRSALPDAEITLIGLPWARSFVERFNRYFNDFIEFPGYPGLPEREPQLDRIPHFFADAQRRRFDLAIQMHGSGSFVNSITVLLGARMNAGFYIPGDYCPDPERFVAFPEKETESGMMLRLMEFLNLPLQGDELEFPLTENDWRELNEREDIREFSSSAYVCIHPGARFPSRRWPPERFAAVGDALSRSGLRVIITGSQNEIELTQYVGSLMREPYCNSAGHSSLGALGALLSGARLLVSNDTGVSHMAAALRVPSVIIVSGSDHKRWAPHNHQLHRTVFHPIDCRPCVHIACPIGHPCALSVTVEEILAEAKKILFNR
jgi:ADP-heptose:LPS heptosyltransferase